MWGVYVGVSVRSICRGKCEECRWGECEECMWR